MSDVAQSTRCSICDGTDIEWQHLSAQDYISGTFFTLSRCRTCGCLRTMSSPSNTADYYGAEYYNSEKGKFNRAIEWLFQYNHKRNAQSLHNRFKARRILEVGCGRGYLLAELKKLGASVNGLESAEAAEWILGNPNIHVASIPDNGPSLWPFDNNAFDLIIFWHVLEHLPDPANSLEEAFRCLSPGGSVYISIPTISSLQARLHPATWFHLDVPRHLYHFSIQGLSTALTKAGFTAPEFNCGDRMQNLFGWLQSTANLFTPRHINTIYRLMQGGHPLRYANKASLFIQILTAWLWIPLGLAGYMIEEFLSNYGTITVVAKGKDSSQDVEFIA